MSEEPDLVFVRGRIIDPRTEVVRATIAGKGRIKTEWTLRTDYGEWSIPPKKTRADWELREGERVIASHSPRGKSIALEDGRSFELKRRFRDVLRSRARLIDRAGAEVLAIEPAKGMKVRFEITFGERDELRDQELLALTVLVVHQLAEEIDSAG